MGERWIRGCVRLLHTPVRANEALRDDGGIAGGRHRLPDRRDPTQEEGESRFSSVERRGFLCVCLSM